MSAGGGARPGLYKADSVIDVAESLGIGLSDAVASALASDIEYRLHQIIEEASRFTRHSKRTVMSTTDVDQALRTLNIEPVYGHSAASALSFRKIQPASGPPIFVVDDEEIDFETVLRDEPIPIPRAARYTAHWLAIEGVQPLIPENPPPPESTSTSDPTKPLNNGTSPRPTVQNGTTAHSTDSAVGEDGKAKPPSVKTHLSRELQNYYQRLIAALVPAADERKRSAALTSLRADAGLAPVLPYLSRWVAEGVVAAIKRDTDNEDVDLDRRSLDIYLDVINALLENERLLVEPYLHQMLPPILSILLTSTLFVPSGILNAYPSEPTPSHLRTHAGSVLARLLVQHGPTYPNLASRITTTLLAALVEQGRMLGTREGALRGLIAVGKEAIRRGIVHAGGGKVVGEDTERAKDMGMDTSGVEQAMIDALEALQPRPETGPDPTTGITAGEPEPLGDMLDEDKEAADTIKYAFGEDTPFYREIVRNGPWARLLGKAMSAPSAATPGMPSSTGLPVGASGAGSEVPS
ncbi:TAF-domain-containing protein [Clavulina sp. PMI_390]|nr:TAF-domain-containing protein [Clavulina sp. PMI_390]